MTSTTPAYVMGYLRNVDFGEEIAQYMSGIDATLTEFGGRFRIHGNPITSLEGTWDGDLIMIEFPSHAAALAWYRSPAYQQILALRTEHAEAMVGVIEGVGPDHRAVDKLAAMLEAATT